MALQFQIKAWSLQTSKGHKWVRSRSLSRFFSAHRYDHLIFTGHYTCTASNSEGEGESNQVLLEIQCKHQFMADADCCISHDWNCFPSLYSVAPICRPGQVQTYNVGRGETSQIQCDVEGIPRDINFVWKFNTSVSEVLDMPSSIVKNNSTRSTIHFKPMTEHVCNSNTTKGDKAPLSLLVSQDFSIRLWVF